MLYATFLYVQNVRGGATTQQPRQQQSGGAAATKTGVTGSEFVTTTDANLRKGPDTSYTQVGVAERGSTVRVLQVSGKWYQVQVIEHGRPKNDPDSADEGWVNSNLLRAKS
jgi:SH3-like domain-containing protein